MSNGNSGGGGYQGRDGDDGKGRGGSRFGQFAGRKAAKPEEELNYKNLSYLSKFVTPNGRIFSRKRTGFGGQDQRKLALAIKHARFIGLLPYVGRS